MKPRNIYIKKIKVDDAKTDHSRGPSRGLDVLSGPKGRLLPYVLICPEQWKYLRLSVGNGVFNFTVLPFGVTSAPRVFTKKMAPVTERIRRTKGLFKCAFLDDFLGKDQDRSFLTSKSQTMLEFIIRIDLIINWEKSELEPTQDLTYIESRFMTALEIVTIPMNKIEAIEKITSGIRRA